MLCAVLVRRLREGVSFGAFRRAWEPVERFGASEARRHESIDRVIESTPFRAIYEVVAEVDLT